MNSIKFSLLLAVISIQSQAFEINEYFAEFRLGTQDQYEKKVERLLERRYLRLTEIGK